MRTQGKSRAGPSVAVVATTVADAASARRLARHIVEQRLAACAQFFPIRSVYRWKGKTVSSKEWALWAKTPVERVHDAVRFIRQEHSYELPEIVVWPLTGGLPTYLAWVRAETRRP